MSERWETGQRLVASQAEVSDDRFSGSCGACEQHRCGNEAGDRRAAGRAEAGENRAFGSEVGERHAPVDERHASVDERHASVDERHASVDERHASVDERHAPAGGHHAPSDELYAAEAGRDSRDGTRSTGIGGALAPRKRPDHRRAVRELVVATKNRGKLIEIAELLHDQDLKLYSLFDFPGMPPVVEDGRTFEENAIKKAKEAYAYTGKPSLADDSGLEVRALGGRPGVLSARYSDPGATDDRNIDKLLGELGDMPLEMRKARFVCSIALVDGAGGVHVAHGYCEGVIGFERRGTGGFGYDPVFVVCEYGKTFAELGDDVKNRISHRAKAMRKMADTIRAVVI